MSALASSSTKENTSSNTGEQKEDFSTKTIPQLRSHLGLAVKSSKSKAAKGSKKQYYSKVELIELANSSSTVIASKAPVDVDNNDDNTKTSSDTKMNYKTGDLIAFIIKNETDENEIKFGEVVGSKNKTVEVSCLKRTALQGNRLWQFEESDEWIAIQSSLIVKHVPIKTGSTGAAVSAGWLEIGFLCGGDGISFCLVADGQTTTPLLLCEDSESEDEEPSTNPAIDANDDKADANDSLAKLFQCKYDNIVSNCSFDLFVKMNPTKEDIFKYMKHPIKLSDRKKIRKERGLQKKSEAMAFIANVNRIIEELSTAEALSEKDLWDDLLKTPMDFFKEQVEVKRKHDLEALGICGNCQIQKVHCKDCNDSHCAEESCDCFDDFIYKCGVCEESLCEHCDLLPKCGVCEGRYILNNFLQHNTITFFNFFFFFFCFCIFPIYFKERFCESCMEKDTCDGCNARCCESCGGFYRCGCCTKKYCNDCNPTWKYHGDTSMCKECFEEDGICDY